MNGKQGNYEIVFELLYLKTFTNYLGIFHFIYQRLNFYQAKLKHPFKGNHTYQRHSSKGPSINDVGNWEEGGVKN